MTAIDHKAILGRFSAAMIEARPEIGVTVAVAGLLGEILERLQGIEARLAVPASSPIDLGGTLERLTDVLKGAPAPQAAKSKRPAAKASPSLDRLAAVGIEAALGPDDLAAFLGRSRREVDRMRAAGSLPKEDFRVGRSPKWRPQTVKDWLASRGAKK